VKDGDEAIAHKHVVPDINTITTLHTRRQPDGAVPASRARSGRAVNLAPGPLPERRDPTTTTAIWLVIRVDDRPG